MSLHLYAAAEGGRVLSEGDTVVDFRGEEWTFMRPTRASDPGRSGKVMVSRPGPGASTIIREFYSTVFDLEVYASLPVRRRTT